MMNPWERIRPESYEGHMRYIEQYALLNQIFKDQIDAFPYYSIGILGIGCGNGLEHVNEDAVVCGYDINEMFLDRCHSCYSQRLKHLTLIKLDLTKASIQIEPCDFLISNLVIEFIGTRDFYQIIRNSAPKAVSVVVQNTNTFGTGVSNSPFSDEFKEVASLLKEVNPKPFARYMKKLEYDLVCRQEYIISADKSLLRMDFSRRNVNPEEEKSLFSSGDCLPS